MAEVNTAEETAKVEAAFGAPFGDTPPAPVAKVESEAKPEPAKPAAAPAVEAPKPQKPEYVRVTRQEWDNNKAAVGKIASLESQIAKMAGSVPNADQIEQRIVEKIRAQTPSGQAVEFSDEDFAELSAEFPELAKLTRTTLERLFKKSGVRGTGPTNSSNGIDVAKEVQKVLLERDEKAFTKAYPTWSEIVGAPAVTGGQPVQTDFRKWLTTQPPEYQKAINETNDWSELKESLDAFHNSQRTAAPAPSVTPNRAAARRAVMEDAVTPKTDGAAPPLVQPISAEDAFGASFQKAKRH